VQILGAAPPDIFAPEKMCPEFVHPCLVYIDKNINNMDFYRFWVSGCDFLLFLKGAT
jgi:hypothetical protein